MNLKPDIKKLPSQKISLVRRKNTSYSRAGTESVEGLSRGIPKTDKADEKSGGPGGG
jgi:hypothetical protein